MRPNYNPGPGRDPSDGHGQIGRDLPTSIPLRTDLLHSEVLSREPPGTAAESNNRCATCNVFPPDTSNPLSKRSRGLAFAAVVVLIYILVVGWFQSFLTPFVIMTVIPISLVGILPGHWLMGAFFTATSMIGFIAGAGIVVRNSIILVDFIELRLKQGMPLAEAVVDAGAVRFRPMLLTAAAVIVGASVMLADPIFQGLAISLMAGEVASLLLSRMTVPVLYYLINRKSVRGTLLLCEVPHDR